MASGFWFNLEHQHFEAKKFRPYTDLAADPASLHGFRGKPTVFGHPRCDDQGDCAFSEVLQYDSDTDSWDTIGYLHQPRRSHEVIEVPVDFCSVLPPLTTETTTTATTEEPTSPPLGPPLNEETAAMIVGGVWNGAARGRVLVSVELFGCPGYEDSSRPLDDFPQTVYFIGGRYVPDGDNEGKVLTCGGLSCANDVPCEVQTRCYEWSPRFQWREEAANLQNGKWNHFMGLVEDRNSSLPDPLQQRVPIVLGDDRITEIYDPVYDEWRLYLPVLDDWISSNCLVQYENKIYHMGSRDFSELDTTEWTLTSLEPFPSFLRNPGKCSITYIDGEQGNVFLHRSCVL